MGDVVSINIKNCNCIKEANITIEKNALNIKYASNGSGKSTIGKALSYDNGKLAELKPYASTEDPYISTHDFANVKIFNEDYVNNYLFNSKPPKDGTCFNTFDVFLRSEKTDNLSKKINEELAGLHDAFASIPEIDGLRQQLTGFAKKVKLTPKKELRKSADIEEFLTGNGAGFHQHHELNRFRSFYNEPETFVSGWAAWKESGKQYAKDGKCPYCAKDLVKNWNTIDEVFTNAFKKSSLETANTILSLINEGVDNGFINEKARKRFKKYVDSPSKKTELRSELKALAQESDYLNNKLVNIVSFRPSAFTYDKDSIDKLADKLEELLIDGKQLERYYKTKKTRDTINSINGKLRRLKRSVGKLKGLFNSYKKQMDDSIKDRVEDINEFFEIAGFPYRFKIDQNGEGQATHYLSPVGDDGEIDFKVTEPKKHLSWGEKNAFSLVMFMFEAISENPDLIILDDPISSFDKNKKHAVTKRLFGQKSSKINLRGKTVILFTHDQQPLIDYVYFRKYDFLGNKIVAQWMANENGILREQEINETSLKNCVTLAKEIAEDKTRPISTRITNLRRYLELVNKDFKNEPAYDIISNLMHGEPFPLHTDKTKMDQSEISAGMAAIKQYINEAVDYNFLFAKVTNVELKKLLPNASSYDRIIMMRILFERDDALTKQLRAVAPGALKFLNEFAHIENDYIFQLNPDVFSNVPTYYDHKIQEVLGITQSGQQPN